MSAQDDFVPVSRKWLENTDKDLQYLEIMLERIAKARSGQLIDGHWPLWARQDLATLRGIRSNIRARGRL